RRFRTWTYNRNPCPAGGSVVSHPAHQSAARRVTRAVQPHPVAGMVATAWGRWRPFWRRWWAFTTAAECVGFAVPALVGLSAWQLALSPLPFFGALVAAGPIDGAMLGFGQQRALRRVVPVATWRCTLWTAAGAGTAWA